MASMAQQLAAQGLAFERVGAVEGRELTAEQKRDSFSPFWYGLLQGRAVTNAELGCSLSHRKVWQMMIDRAQNWVVIFEDDAELLPQFASQLAVIENETRDFDMVQLYAFRDPDKLDHVSPDAAFKVMRYSGPHGSTAAYAMRLSGAKKLMNIGKVWTAPDKWTWLSAVTGLNCCGIFPYPVRLEDQHSAVSTISAMAERKNNRLWLIAVLPILRVVRFSIAKVRGV